MIKLRLWAVDMSTPFKTLNVWVNETPLFGVKGRPIRNKYPQVLDLDTTITVTLSQGRNTIETSVTNANGIESLRIPLHLNYIPEQPVKEKLYFLGIGVDRYKESQHNLMYSVKDIRGLAAALKEKYGDAIVIDTLFNEKVTAASIKALKKKLQSARVDDKVILAYSGHGLLDRKFDYYLSTHNVSFDRPESGGLLYEDFEGLLDGIASRKKLILIDACHSGEVDREELAAINRRADSLGIKGLKAFRYKDKKSAGLKNSFELMQELFVNVSRSTGATVISAAAGTQFALEKGDLEHGVFTYSILEFMRTHSTGTVSELKRYVNRRVSELTDGMQQPTTRSEVKWADWKIWGDVSW